MPNTELLQEEAIAVMVDEFNGVSGRSRPSHAAMHLANVALHALKAAGYAVVALPKPDDDHGDGIAFWWSQQRDDVGAVDGLVVVRSELGDSHHDTDDARALAAALLAAAEAAGGVQ